MILNLIRLENMLIMNLIVSQNYNELNKIYIVRSFLNYQF